METFFASPYKKDGSQLALEIDHINHSSVISNLMNSVGGLLAVLNEERQILAINDSFLKMIGIQDPASILGLRPGEAVKCVHADDRPHGCGTTRYCETCGAAVAIVTSLAQNQPAERICALRAVRENMIIDISLLVRAHPIKINGSRFLLLFLQDITLQEQRAALERTFFHDINNIIGMLSATTELLAQDDPSDMAQTIYNTSLRLKNEISIQRCLLKTGFNAYKPLWHETPAEKIFEDLRIFSSTHPLSGTVRFTFQENNQPVMIKTDLSLLLRILYNMITNAIEASGDAGDDAEVKVWMEQDRQSVCFCVWNRREIPEAITCRIFQRNFSTKQEPGRGIGTYSMKLFGEQILGGKVWFTSSRAEGTTFYLSIPI